MRFSGRISRGTEVASCIDDLGLYAETVVQLVNHEPRDDAAALGQVRHPAEKCEFYTEALSVGAHSDQ